MREVENWTRRGEVSEYDALAVLGGDRVSLISFDPSPLLSKLGCVDGNRGPTSPKPSSRRRRLGHDIFFSGRRGIAVTALRRVRYDGRQWA